ncbi:hypothetical protein EW146_g3296 [Bondarzewia mesenterica]|uniref:Major facilitator superfamily (MFS) profile domain-containing protein n=1 Tax=Bondarzewia mesenterica TaxID=1095465 RepID=A0A4S4LY87_9AGAM|nr:hypothetical protein EW146_g3296 [Bondarzewia mesenterica]
MRKIRRVELETHDRVPTDRDAACVSLQVTIALEVPSSPSPSQSLLSSIVLNGTETRRGLEQAQGVCFRFRRQQTDEEVQSRHGGKPQNLTWRRTGSPRTKIASWNICGLAASQKKGFKYYVEAEDPDILILTETKVNNDPVDPALTERFPYRYWSIADKKTYSGTAILSKHKPINVDKTLPGHPNPEFVKGRIITLEFENYYLIATYVVNAGEKLKTMDAKKEWNTHFEVHIRDLDKKKPVIWGGDLNVAPTEIDLTNAKRNWNKTPGYTEEETTAFKHILNPPKDASGANKFVDIWRNLHPDDHHYTYWSYRFNCRAKGIGWRLDMWNLNHWQLLGQLNPCPTVKVDWSEAFLSMASTSSAAPADPESSYQPKASRVTEEDRFPDVAPYVFPTLTMHGVEEAPERSGQTTPSQSVAALPPARLSLKERAKRTLGMYLHNYTLCSLFASLGGFSFGFDTGSIGPVTVMPQFKAEFDPISPTLQGLIVSSILITASSFSIVAGPLSDRISRTRTFALGGAVFSIGSIIVSAAHNLPTLFVGRCLAGVGEGLFLSTITVYILEIAPTNIRGRLSCTTQLLITIGIALGESRRHTKLQLQMFNGTCTDIDTGYFISYGSVKLSSSISWRLPFMLQAIVSCIFSVGSLFLPHSPRWLKHVERTDEAARAWLILGFTATEAEKEQEVEQRERNEIQVQREDAASSVGADARQPGTLATAKMLWGKDVRRRTILGIFLMGMQQACGIDGVLYYAPVLFSQAGLSSTTAAFLASGVSGLLNIACTIITQIFTDNWGRRTSMIRGGAVISGTMLLIGTLYASNASVTTAGRWTIIALIYIFVVAFSMSWAVVNRIYCSEIQPMHTRAAASSLGQCANWAVNWVIAFSTPLFLSKSSSGPYFLFGGCTLLTVVVCALFQPESRGVSLEGLDVIFEVSPWRKFIARWAPRMHGNRGPQEEAQGIPLRPIGV